MRFKWVFLAIFVGGTVARAEAPNASAIAELSKASLEFSKILDVQGSVIAVEWLSSKVLEITQTRNNQIREQFSTSIEFRSHWFRGDVVEVPESWHRPAFSLDYGEEAALAMKQEISRAVRESWAPSLLLRLQVEGRSSDFILEVFDLFWKGFRAGPLTQIRLGVGESKRLEYAGRSGFTRWELWDSLGLIDSDCARYASEITDRFVGQLDPLHPRAMARAIEKLAESIQLQVSNYRAQNGWIFRGPVSESNLFNPRSTRESYFLDYAKAVDRFLGEGKEQWRNEIYRLREAASLSLQQGKMTPTQFKATLQNLEKLAQTQWELPAFKHRSRYMPLFPNFASCNGALN